MELRSSLKTDAWEGAPGLASLYDYLHTRLINANIKRDADHHRALPRPGPGPRPDLARGGPPDHAIGA